MRDSREWRVTGRLNRTQEVGGSSVQLRLMALPQSSAFGGRLGGVTGPGVLLAAIDPVGQLVHFDWTLSLGDAIVGVGTLGLAAVTFWLAWQSRREVEVSTESIDLTRRGIEIQDMPFLIAIPSPEQIRNLDATTNPNYMWWGWEPAEDINSLRLRLWNIGKGPAIARDIRLQADGAELLHERSAFAGELVIGPGDTRDLNLLLEGPPPDVDQDGLFRIYFAHPLGAEYMTRSQARVSPGGVRCTNYRHCPSDGEGRNMSPEAASRA